MFVVLVAPALLSFAPSVEAAAWVKVKVAWVSSVNVTASVAILTGVPGG